MGKEMDIKTKNIKAVTDKQIQEPRKTMGTKQREETELMKQHEIEMQIRNSVESIHRSLNEDEDRIPDPENRNVTDGQEKKNIFRITRDYKYINPTAMG